MDNKHILNQDFHQFVRSFRIGSPVQVHGKNTFIQELPNEEEATINGFKVYEDSSILTIDDIKPIPLDEDYFARHDGIFSKEGEVYECSGNNHVISVSIDGHCSIDGNDFGIISQHELKNILKEVCGISVPLYDGICNEEDRGLSTIRTAATNQ